MAYTDTDLRRDVLLACNKAQVDMSLTEISEALGDIAGEITAGDPKLPNLVAPPPE